MTVPSTSAWTLDTDELISAAMERLRRPQEAGYDIKIARRAIQYTFAQLATEGINLAQVEKQSLTMTIADVDYTLADDTQDVLEVTYRDLAETSPRDLPVLRIGRDEYHYIADKSSPGRPTKFYLDRQRDAPVMYFWQAPDKAYRVDYYRIRKFRDVGSMTQHLDVPTRWLGLITAGVAFYIAKTVPDLQPDHRAELAADWAQERDTILQEDRDRAPLRIEPDLSCYARI